MIWARYLLISVFVVAFAFGRGLSRRAAGSLRLSQRARLARINRRLRALLILALIMVWLASLFHFLLGLVILVLYAGGEAVWIYRALERAGTPPGLTRRLLVGSSLMSLSWLLLIYLLPILFPQLSPSSLRWIEA